MWNRIDLKQQAKIDFRKDYWGYVITALIASLSLGEFAVKMNEVPWHSITTDSFYGFEEINVFGGFGAAGTLISLLLLSPLYIGTRRFFLSNLYKEDGKTELDTMLYAFRNSYGNVVLVRFLKKLFLVLWTMLFFFPGVVKFFEYFMVDYILAENPGIDHRRAFEISKLTMHGEKMDVFVLYLSFIGWYILAGISCGIVGIFYVGPYVAGTMARLYDTLKEKSIQNGIATYDDYNC